MRTLFGLADLSVAYRKAKAEAFYENTHFNALAFAEYEQNLEDNLVQLLRSLRSGRWHTSAALLGGFAYAPKSLDGFKSESGELYFRSLDPLEEWRRKWRLNRRRRIGATFRLVVKPTIDFHIVSALWVLKVGHKYDACLDSSVAYANRLRRYPQQFRFDEARPPHAPPNLDCLGLFKPYFAAYRKWREDGLEAMRTSLRDGRSILAVTMDLASFYHRVCPEFLLDKRFLKTIDLHLDDSDLSFTGEFVNALNVWYRETPDYRRRPLGALPVGLSASKVISNVLLAEFDREVTSRLAPIYFGRYVDDVFLVLDAPKSFSSGREVMKWLARDLSKVAKFEERDGDVGLRLTLRYAAESDLVFSGSKQKIFNLSGEHGIDLVGHIEEQIRRQSSEHRLLAQLPISGEEMAARALLAQPAATLEPDALRKADVISVRRLGFSLLLRDVECYARDIRPSSWKERRRLFYELVHRHAITPSGLFEFFTYIHRVLGVMIACMDFSDAIELIRRIGRVMDVLEETTSAGTRNAAQFAKCRSYFSSALLQVTLQATSVARFRWSRRVLDVFEALQRELRGRVPMPTTLRQAKSLSVSLFLSDWGRRPYKEMWLNSKSRYHRGPSIPTPLAIRRSLRLGAMRRFRMSANLTQPYWPALAFPTRPISLQEISRVAPRLLEEPKRLRQALLAFRGARARESDDVIMMRSADIPESELIVNGKGRSQVTVAVPSFLTTYREWLAAVSRKPSLTIARYERIRAMVNAILRDSPLVDYIILPECSVPANWIEGIASQLAKRRISLIAGLEYVHTPKGLRNDAFLSITTEWPWYPTSIFYLQPKFAPSHEERRNLWKLGRRRLYSPRSYELGAPTYVHGAFCFSVLICSDLTNIRHREACQGKVDALFVLEWNMDLDSFSVLVESAAHDLHAYIVQVNNREYGDSRIRAPRRAQYLRDVVRVRGGEHDYFVVAKLNVEELRQYQRRPSDAGAFKPLPIGYQMSDRRRTGG